MLASRYPCFAAAVARCTRVRRLEGLEKRELKSGPKNLERFGSDAQS